MSKHFPFIVSGGPGSGKSSLLDAIAQQGFMAFPEVPRLLIEEQSQLDDGILPWQQLGPFAELCFVKMLQQRQLAQAHEVMSFVDRAIGDICAYLSLGELAIPETIQVQARQGYQPIVLFCKPTVQTYVQDEVRPYPFEQALVIHDELLRQYQTLGFHVVDIPFMAIEERVEFVLQLCQNYVDALS